MNRSGYDKVYQLLLGHPDMKEALSVVRHTADHARILSWKVESHEIDKWAAKAVIGSHTAYVAGTDFHRWKMTYTSDFPVRSMIDEGLCRRVVDEWFGTEVKTYGCEQFVCAGGLKAHKGLGRNRKEYTKYKSLFEWILANAVEIVPEIQACKTRLESEMRSIESSPEHAAKALESRAEAAAEAIKKVISRYAHLGDDVVREGLRLATVAHVMDI